jgi:IS30 family transposase
MFLAFLGCTALLLIGAKHWKSARRHPDLQAYVKQRLAMEHSPEQIAGR